MTRENEMINAARERADRHQIAEMQLYGEDKCDYSYERIYNSEIASFEAGAEWADNHPKSPWISVKDDLPCNHEKLIDDKDKDTTFYVIALIHGLVGLSRMEKFKNEWHWTTDEPSHWFAITELQKIKLNNN